MRYRIVFAILFIAAGLFFAVSSAWRQQVSAAADETQAIQKATDAYAAAFNKGDVDAVVSFWAVDAEHIDEAGQTIKGRDGLAATFKKALQEDKGLKVQIKTTAVRMVKDDVAMQDGSASLTRGNGETAVNPFSALWVKTDGKWLLRLVRDLPGAPKTSDASTAALKDLGWLVGEWTHEEKGTKTTINARWMKGKKFLLLEYSIQKQKEELLSLIQVIGWEPTEGRLHSWVFDAHGGFGEGAWSRQANTWTVESAGVTSDGRHGSVTSKWILVDDNSFTYQTQDREIGGQRLPDTKITYQRTKQAK